MISWAGLGEGTSAVWTRAQALRIVTSDVISRLLADGVWQSPLPGIYADGGFVLTSQQWAVAVALASGGRLLPQTTTGLPELRAIACGRTAARVLDLPLVDDDDPATGAQDHLHHDVATAARLGVLRHGPVQVHRRGLRIARRDLGRHDCGVWLTTPVQTLYDLTALLGPQAHVCTIDAALRTGLVTAADLADETLRRERGRWVVAFREAVDLADGRAESAAESLARLLLTPVLPELESQVRLEGKRGATVARFDLAVRRLRLAVEVDGKAGHAGEVMVAKDRRRDRRTEALGWHTERVTWWELRVTPQAVVARILAAAAQREATLSRAS